MNSKNPCKRIIGGESPAKVLLDIAKSDPESLKDVGQELDGHEVLQLGVITSESLRASAVESVIFDGFLLDLYQRATAEEKQLFSNMLEDVDISRTQAYRSIAVWRKLGPQLANSPDVMRRFVPEAMKLICEARVSDAAREEVLDLATSGRRVNIKLVQEVCTKHNVAVGETAKPKSQPSIAKQPASKRKSVPATEAKRQGAIFSFVGDFVRLVVKAKTESGNNDPRPVLADVIRDTEKCLAELRRRYAVMKEKSRLNKVG